MRVLFFRDKKAHDLIQISTVTHQQGVNIGVPYRIEASSDLQFYYNRTNEFFRPLRVRYWDIFISYEINIFTKTYFAFK